MTAQACMRTSVRLACCMRPRRRGLGRPNACVARVRVLESFVGPPLEGRELGGSAMAVAVCREDEVARFVARWFVLL